jgi:glycosyltransferase involved in cell wall biosynthesis
MATAPGGPVEDIFMAAGVHVEPVPFARPLDVPSVRALVRIIAHQGIDIVHSMGVRADFHARLAARLTRRARVISTVAMPASGFESAGWRRALYQIGERVSERWVDAFLTDSEHVRRQLIEEHRIAPSRVRTVHIGADPGTLDPARADGARVRRELGLGPGPVVGSVGRLVLQKAHGDFLDAVALASRRIPNLQALVVGEGPLGPTLRAHAEAVGVAELTRFIGVRHDLADLLAALDVLVIASRRESIPVVLYEAMALARPIVATTVGGIPEVVEDGRHAWLVPPADPAGLAKAVGTLLEDPGAAAAMGSRARERVAERFRVQACVDAVAACYRDVGATG